MFINQFLSDNLLFLVIAGSLSLVLVGVLLTKKKKPVVIDVTKIIACFGEKNILRIDFKRQKINILTKNPKDVDYDQLKEQGVLGVNIVGDTVKFYFEKDNEAIYNTLKSTLER